MSKTIRYTLISLREMMTSAGPFALLTVALLGLAYWWLDPEPPKHVTLATGPDQSAYDEFGHRYAKALAAYGIEVTLVPSEGSSQNLEWLNAGKVDPCLAQPTLSGLSPWAASRAFLSGSRDTTHRAHHTSPCRDAAFHGRPQTHSTSRATRP